MLQLAELTKKYNTGELALKGVTLEIPKGQVLALIGPCLLYTSPSPRD